MPQTLYNFACRPQCGFAVTSNDRNEVIEVAMVHSKKRHPDLDPTREGLGKMVQETRAATP